MLYHCKSTIFVHPIIFQHFMNFNQILPNFLRLRHSILLLLVLFALLPCSIKKTSMEIVQVEFVKKGNKTVAKSSSVSCAISDFTLTDDFQVSKIVLSFVPLSSLYFFKEYSHSHSLTSLENTRYFLSSYPPIYLLYQQLKLGFASSFS